MVKGRPMLLGIIVCVATLGVTSAHAANKCQGAKIKDAGKKASCLAGLQAKAEATSTTVDPLKAAKCDAKVSAAYAKLESKAGACVTSGDASAIESKVDTFINDLVSALATGGATTAKCQAAKIKDAGKKAQCVTGLQAKVAAAGGTIDPVKLGKCQAKVSAAYAKLESKAGACATSGDAGAIEAKVDSFTNDVNTELNPPPTTSTTTTTIPVTCEDIVPGHAIAPNTYTLNGTTDPQKRCITGSTMNRFGPCNSDADCGGIAQTCLQLPWVTADGQTLNFPTGIQTTFTVETENTATCEHTACVPCGNPNGVCTGIPACALAGNPAGCIPRATQGCCDAPAFTVPVFFVNLLGGLCSRVDQIDCGVGVVNTSNPQTGDNEVNKVADTSDPGPDCIYNTPDDPVQPACAIQGNDFAGKIVRTVGDGSADAPGIHFRLQTPELSTTWMDVQSPSGTCAPNSKLDSTCNAGTRINQTCTTDNTNATTGCPGATCPGCCQPETPTTQLLIKAEPTSAGASGAFQELGPTGSTCHRAGAGFASGLADGPVSIPGAQAGGPARPQSYDGSVGAITTAVSEVFSGSGSPIHDIGFVAITPNQPAVVVTHQACSCTVTPGCPE